MMSKNVHAFELKLGKRALILFLIGMSCLLFIVFLFGVTVGKNIDAYPEKYARGVPGMVMQKLGWSANKAETASEASRDSAKVVAEEKGSEEKKMPVTTPVGTNEKQPPAQAVVRTQEQKPQSPSVAEQAKTKSPPIKERYQVQVVSLKEREKANHFCKRLTNLGFKPSIVVTEIPEKGKWFRVTLEGFESREQAQKAADNMAKKIKGLNCVISKAGERNN